MRFIKTKKIKVSINLVYPGPFKKHANNLGLLRATFINFIINAKTNRVK
jgi:hypothetical protein